MTDEHHEPLPALDRLCDAPVFIVGSPRSGTTALAHALGRHPALWVSKESYFLQQLFGNGRVSQVWEHNQRRVTPSWLRHEGVGREEFLGFIGLGMNALYSSRSGGRRWIEQTPIYTPMIDDLAHMFPTAKFLHMLRDGRAVVRSMGRFDELFDDEQKAAMSNELPGWTDDVQLACETWSDWVRTARSFERAHPDRCITVRNEELRAAPETGFGSIFEFLEIDHDAGPIASFAGKRINSSFRDAPERPADLWDDWPPEIRKLFAHEAGETLVREGYEDRRQLDRWSSGTTDEPGLR